MESNTKANEKTMKALVLGQDRSVTVQDVPIPKPRDGEVLVKILAAPINPSDIVFLKGFYSSEKPLPCVPGFEGSGIVVQNGGGFIGWSMVNKRVAVSVQNGFNGTYGQYAVANSQEIMPIPSEISLESASMSFVNPLTALVMLSKVKSANVKAIVHTAAASSLGRMMNRLFTSEGIPIINIVRREEQVELLKKEGAKIVLNSEKEGFEQELTKIAKKLNATLCYDAVSGEVTTKILRALPKNSTIEIYGVMSQQPTLSGLEVRQILFSNKTIKGFWLTEELKDFGLFSKLKLIKKLSNLLGNELKSSIAKEVSLDKFDQGLEYYMSNMTEGKVLVKPWLGYEEEVKDSKKQKEEKKKSQKKEEKKQEKKEEKKEQNKEEKKEQNKELKQESTTVPEEKESTPKKVQVVEVKATQPQKTVQASVEVKQVTPATQSTPVQAPQKQEVNIVQQPVQTTGENTESNQEQPTQSNPTPDNEEKQTE